MTTDLHTPLESFLLLRNLSAGHHGALSFDTISKVLKTNPILQRNDGYNATRLDPEPLKALYLKLLKDEARLHLQNESSGKPSSSPRKRKLSSPQLESLEDATSYAHLLPSLIQRAYFHYQTVVVQAVRQEESKVRQLQKNVASRTKKPEEGAEQRNVPPVQTGSHGVPSIQGLLRHEEERARQEQREHGIKQGQGQMRSGGYNTIPPVMNGSPFPKPPSTDYKGAQQPVYGASPSTGSADTPAPYLPPPPLPLPAHPPLQYPLPSNDYAVRRPSPSGSAASPISRNSQQPLPSQERPSQTPIILPPPAGLLRSTVVIPRDHPIALFRHEDRRPADPLNRRIKLPHGLTRIDLHHQGDTVNSSMATKTRKGTRNTLLNTIRPIILKHTRPLPIPLMDLPTLRRAHIKLLWLIRSIQASMRINSITTARQACKCNTDKQHQCIMIHGHQSLRLPTEGHQFR